MASELIALADGFRESAESWADLLGDCKRRGMAAPVLAIGDGALGFSSAVRDVFPTTREQRCWFHKMETSCPRCRSPPSPGRRRPWPRSGRPRTVPMPRRPRRTSPTNGAGAKWPKAVAKITDDLAVLLEFCYNCRSTGCTCAPPTRSSPRSPPCGCAARCQGTGSRRRRRDGIQADRVRSDPLAGREALPHLVALVRAGATFKGHAVEHRRPDEVIGQETANRPLDAPSYRLGHAGCERCEVLPLSTSSR